MALARQRRNTPPLSLILPLFVFALLQITHAASAVLGLDVGTEYIKAALVKPGVPLDIVLTKDSKRKESAVIGFKPSASSAQGPTNLPERLYGSDALAVAPRFSGDVYPNLKPLLGATADNHAAIAAYKWRHPGLDLTEADDGSHVLFRTSGKAQDTFTVEELLAMEMFEMKQNAERMAGKGFAVRNAVITIPAFYTVDERRAIELAANLAGLEVMSLISDGLAVGLNYATSRKFPNVDQGEKPEYHLVYDMGAGSTTASILRFQARTVKDVGKFNKTIQEVNVIGNGWDRTLGGDYMNEIIVQDMVRRFVESNGAKKLDIGPDMITKHGRTMAKLWREAERLRQVLSANTATSINMEGLYEDIDFKYKLSRGDFEKLVSEYTSRATWPVKDALSEAKLDLDDLDSIVLHGGVVRTPFVQKELEALVGDAAKLRTNVNADEAAVFGAAFRAAGLSPSFKVKDIKSNDAAGYAVNMKLNAADGKFRSQKIFVPTSQAGTVKQLALNISEDFSISISQQVGGSARSEDVREKTISNVKIANLTTSVAELVSKYGCTKEGTSTTLYARLDPVAGIPEISSGSVSCEVEELEKKGGVVDGVKGLFGFGGKKDQEILGDDDEAATSTSTLSQSESSPSATSSSNSNSSSSTPIPTSTPKASKKKVETFDLAIDVKRTDIRQPTPEQREIMREILQAYRESDDARRLREESFNTLESYTYRARDYLSEDGFKSVSTEPQREEIENLIRLTGEWLHVEGASAEIAIIKDKYASLKGLIDPIQKRKDEQQKRPKAIQSLRNILNQTETFVKLIRDQIDKAAAASASSSATTQVSSQLSEESSDLEDLDDEPSPTTAPSTSTPDVISPFSEDDYEDLLNAFRNARDWLAEQLVSQNELLPTDNPVVSSTEINARSKQLSDTLSRMLMKQTKLQKPPKPSSSKSKGKGKGSKGRSTSPRSASSSTNSNSLTSSRVESPTMAPHNEL